MTLYCRFFSKFATPPNPPPCCDLLLFVAVRHLSESLDTCPESVSEGKGEDVKGRTL